MVSYLWRHPFPWFDSEFLTIISMRAIRAAFEVKGLLNPEQRFATEQFADRFLSRVQRLSKGVAWCVFIGVVSLLVVLNVFYAENPIVKTSLLVVAVLTLIGSLTDLRKQVGTWTEQLIKKLFGYHFASSPPNPVKG
jgi:RsiW-degrading membrane proteinase PrsW (M82 family)